MGLPLRHPPLDSLSCPYGPGSVPKLIGPVNNALHRVTTSWGRARESLTRKTGPAVPLSRRPAPEGESRTANSFRTACGRRAGAIRIAAWQRQEDQVEASDRERSVVRSLAAKVAALDTLHCSWSGIAALVQYSLRLHQ